MSSARTIAWQIEAPESELASVRAGDAVELSGRVLTLRDASAARLAQTLERNQLPPISLQHRVMYAVGPSPAKPGQVIGSAGPTTTARMGRCVRDDRQGRASRRGHGRVPRARRGLLRRDWRSRCAAGQANQRGEGGRI